MEGNNARTSDKTESETALKDDSIANELIRARSVLGWTQNELHQRTGISRAALKSYESGRNKPGAREIRLLCEALSISPNKLLFGKEEFQRTGSGGSIKEFIKNRAAQDGGITKAFSLAFVFSALTDEEQHALLTLCESILAGRKVSRSQWDDITLDAVAAAGLMTNEGFIAEFNKFRTAIAQKRDELEKEK